MTAAPPDVIDRFRGPYWFLSNMYPCSVVHQGFTFKSLEHGYQSYKCNTMLSRLAVSRARDGFEAKQLVRQMSHRVDWKEIRLVVMTELLHAKFSDPALRQLLRDTRPARLIEGGTGDLYWGATRKPNGGWYGLNKLGELLMQIREGLS